jgi:hypothetical protein
LGEIAMNGRSVHFSRGVVCLRMKLIKPILCTAFGVVIGVTVMATAGRVEATPQARPAISDATGHEVVIRPLKGPALAHLSTVKDVKTSACFYAAGYPDRAGFASLAPAPIMACQ